MFLIYVSHGWLRPSGRCGWAHLVVNASLQDGVVLLILKAVYPFLKKPMLDPKELDKFNPISNFIFSENVIALQLRMKEGNYLFIQDSDLLKHWDGIGYVY